MHDPYPQPGIGSRLRLIPPVAGEWGTGSHGESDERPDKRPQERQCLLVVEDEFLLSAVLSADLQESGYDVLGPFATVEGAMKAARSESFDGAILDINLRGELVYPLAEELKLRGIPFVFLSGYEAASVPEAFRGHKRLAKPADHDVILRAVHTMLRSET